MALRLVVTTTFPGYARGAIISNADTINAIRSSEYASLVVLVSDTIIPPPDPPAGGGSADYLALKALYDQIAAENVQQQAALSAILSVNSSQAEAIVAQGQQILTLNASVLALAAKIETPGGGTPVSPNLADDLPLSEDDGLTLVTDGGKTLVGDRR